MRRLLVFVALFCVWAPAVGAVGGRATLLEDAPQKMRIRMKRPAASSGGSNPFTGTTRSVTCSGTITTNFQNAVDSSVSGDIVSIGAGSCTTGSISVTNKNILIQGQGQGTTNLSTGTGGFLGFSYTGSNEPKSRVTAMTVTGTCGACTAITITAQAQAAWIGGFRFDHLTLTYSSTIADGGIFQLFGPMWGVIDNNIITNHSEAAILTDLSIATEDGTISNLYGAWAASQAYTPGAAKMLYIENNTFAAGFTPPGFNMALDTFYRGARIVFRYNTLTNTNLYSHWTSAGNWNTVWWEVYNNSFTMSPSGGDFGAMRLQGGGTGLIYNNTAIGYDFPGMLSSEQRVGSQSTAPLLLCDGTHTWDGANTDASAPGWPCLSQTGRDAGKTMAQIQAGTKQASFPLYLWNNGPQNKCYNSALGGSACDNSFTILDADAYLKSSAHSTSGFGNGDVDWSKTASQPSGAGTHTLTYTAYTYPHPCVTSFTWTCGS